MTGSTQNSISSANINLFASSKNVKCVMVKKIMGKEFAFTSDANKFQELLELQEKKDENIAIVYLPENTQLKSILNIHYIMQGPYPNIENVEYLGKLAKKYLGNLFISNRVNVLKDAELLLKESHIRYLTGNSNIFLQKKNYRKFTDLKESNPDTNMIALSKKSTSIFEMNEFSNDDIIEFIKYLNIPLMVL